MQRLKLFGGISIETDAGPVAGRAVQRRRLALLAMLATARAMGMSRDKLIAYLWPDASAENGRHFLSDSVYRINRALGGDVIVGAADALRLDTERLPNDIDDFEAALARGDTERAVALYTGPFLDGFHLADSPDLERWVDAERDRLAREYARVLESLAQQADRNDDRVAAVRWWRRLAAHDPHSSRITLGLMCALDAAGERAAAIQHARIHAVLLGQELEIGPDPEVLEMVERLRAEGQATHHAKPSAAGPPARLEPSEAAFDTRREARHDRRPRRLVPAVLALVLLTSFAGWVADRAFGARGSEIPIRTIAVLPFANLSVPREDDYFSDGMTEELITTLGRLDGVAVASRTSVFAFKDSAVDVREVGRRLDADAVIEGSVRKSERMLRINVQLVRTENGYTLWSDTYDRQLDDVFEVQKDIARAVVAALLGTAIRPASVELAERSTQDAEAYDLYLRGRFAWHQRTREGLMRAIEYFDQAVARAPEYARAWVGAADARAVAAFYEYLAPAVAYPQAEAAARRALEIDPGMAEPHATLGYVLTYYHLDWPRAEDAFRRALAIDPNYSTAHQWYANLLTVAGRFDEAEREMRMAQEADPLSLIANAALGWSYYYAGRYDDALEQCQRTLALNADYQLAHLWGGWALEALGRSDEGREWLGRAVALSGASVLTRLALAHALAGSESAPLRDSARAIVGEIEALRSRGDYIPAYEISKVHLALGDRSTALQWLELARVERSRSMALLRVDPQLGPLRGDPRFVRLLNRAFALEPGAFTPP
ncbi:MAG TPA: tetratricopeptide repeat protein [Gemmatimonadaceae bacterium]|nr:tetratricopeptide repeat protein [Gemmatimonadaceae bacterium]